MLPPMGGPLPLPGPPTPEMQEKLRKIRLCVIGTFAAAIGRFCTGDIPINELLCGIVGVFLLNDDPNMAPCYACLASSPLGQCSMGGHGLSCVMAYSFLAGLNAIFLMLKLFTGGPFVLVSFCCQATGAFLGLKLNGLVTATAAEGPMMPLGLGNFPGTAGMGPGGTGGTGGTGGMGGPEPNRPGPPPGPPPGPSFQAFQGTGMRLGG
ncbi:unnamed protein product [Effrenium voratum]|uniref:Uncharacterized protein n=1 Tax=Effrenium voratum TaxID=2562239 RepID=A0AA36HMZ9_9DINO|nr:unnamed protein product [Effrenium voratum]CAJ1430468.1 unnamed protein product [Effrenium voratum]